MRTEHRFLAASFALMLFAAGSPAFAFCRTETNGLRAGCTITADDCCTDGKPLYWKNVCVSYSINQKASAQVPLAEASSAFRRAFATWSDAKCSAAGETPSIDVYELANTGVSKTEYNSNNANVHVIVFRDASWPHSDNDNTLSLTTLTFDTDTGEIFDADLEVNTAQQSFTLKDPVPPNGFDFASVVTHEAGHFLGLAHSPKTTATMFAHYTSGATAMRALTADDTSGICAIYPPSGVRPTYVGEIPSDACDPTPRHGLQTDPNQVATNVSHGCSATPRDGRAGSTGGFAYAVAALALAWSRRSRRARLARAAGVRVARMMDPLA